MQFLGPSLVTGASAPLQVEAASKFYSGTGVPSSGLGANSDFYFRTDASGAAQAIYQKQAGAWVAVTGASSSSTVALRTVSADYTCVSSDNVVLVNAGSGPIIITLASPASGQEVTIKKIDTSGNPVTIVPPSGNIDGGTEFVIGQTNQAATIVSDGTNQFIL